MTERLQPTWDIHNCPLAKRCRMRWEKLEPFQGDADIRFCNKCERSVHLCRTDEDLARHSALGHCVALLVMEVRIEFMGEPRRSPRAALKPDDTTS